MTRTGWRVRSNPRLTVVALDALDESQRVLLEDLRAEPDIVAVACVPAQGASLKAVSATTVELLRQLNRPRLLGDDDLTAVLLRDSKTFERLVLDDFLQVEQGRAFVGGPRALRLVCESDSDENTDGPIRRLGEQALRYGARLAIRTPQDLARRLYTYNTAPQSPRWRARLRGVDDFIRYLDVGEGSSLGSTLSKYWVAPNLVMDATWWMWTTRNTDVTAARGDLSAKIYVSPTLGALPAALRLAVPVLLDHGAPTFKLGVGLTNLLRPDKFVVYFNDRSQMFRCGVDLVHSLGSLEAQGVPFTGSVNGSALVSWGVDPPSWVHLLKWRDRDSWRSWLTERLARYLVAAAGVQGGSPPWEFATVRVGLDGVDTRDWTPRADMWRRTSAIPVEATA